MTQLETLKLRTGESGGVLLEALLDAAKDYILAYTRRTELDWLPAFNGVQEKIAVIEYNRLGAEGFSSRSEGGVSTAFLGAGDYPDSVTKTLNPYRLIGVV